MWPRPRPDILAIVTPQAATSGASTTETLSPTPPVLCFPTVGTPRPERSTRRPDASIASVSTAVSTGVMPRSTMAMSRADVW